MLSNRYKVGRRGQWRERVKRELNTSCVRTRCFHNIHDRTGTRRQWGGTGVLAHGTMAHLAMGTGCDKAKLGRWTWARYRGKRGAVLRCVSIYRPVPNHDGPSSVWSQQKNYFESQNDDRDPQDAFWEDLRAEAQEWLAEGDQLIIGGDVNDEIRDPQVETFFSDLGMHNLIFEHV